MDSLEAFMLACVNGKNGALFNSRTILSYGLSGIALYELYQAGRLNFDGKNVVLDSSSHIGNEFLDNAIDYIARKQSSYKASILTARLSYKVERFAKRLLEKLEDSGIIRIEQSRFLGLIPYNRYFVSGTNEYRRLVNEIREIIRREDRRPEPQTALFISILSSCNVLHRLFDKDERKQYHNRFRRIGKAEYFETLDEFGVEVHKAVRSVIAATRAAAA